MKIVAASDFHGSVEAAKNLHSMMQAEKPDLALVCGDISDFGDATDVQVVLHAFFGKDISGYYVTGNCDPPELLNTEVSGFEERNLHAKVRLHSTALILGLGGSTPTPFPTPTQLRQDQILTIMQHLTSEIQETPHRSLIFLLHNPPFNTKTDRSSSGTHAGSRILRDFAVKLKPQVILHGHIHEARGIDKIEGSWVVNPGPAFHGFYAIANIEDGMATVELREI